METFFIYLSKVAAITIIFYGCYQLFLKKHTFFNANRHFLVAGLVAALALPFLVFTKTVYIDKPVLEQTSAITSTIIEPAERTTAVVQKQFEIDWLMIFAIIYTIGVLFMLGRLFLQFVALRKLINTYPTSFESGFKLVEVDTEIAPFSFFNTIVFNPSLYTKDELAVILAHEKAHCSQRHSLDLIATELFIALQWFNPFSWLYKRSIQQNLEFIADYEALTKTHSKAHYQKTLLKVSIGQYNLTLTNNFFNSLIKKRIVMINQQSSQKRNLLKMAFILPFLAIFMYSFNVKEETKFKTEPPAVKIADEYISPIAKKDLQKITSDFGMHKSPFTKKMEFHNGIDLVAKIGTEVLAASSGQIILAKNDGKHGNRLIIEHKDGNKTSYSHLQKFNVKVNDHVNMGDVIAFVGNTGLSTGSHLHFEVLKEGNALNPRLVVASLKTVDTSGHHNESVNSSTQDKGKEKMGENPLIILNGKAAHIKETETEELHILGELKMIKPSKAIKKYGQAAKDGAYEVKGEIKLVPKKNIKKLSSNETVSFKITKNTSEQELDKLKELAKNKYNCELKIENLKRNSKGIITDISISFANKNGTASSSQNNNKGIAPIIFGYDDDGGIFITSDTKMIHNNNQWVLDTGVELIEQIEEEEKDEKEEEEIIVEQKIINKHYINNTTSDQGIQKVKSNLKKHGNLDLKVEKLKRNKLGEIIRIKLTLSDGKGKLSSATFKNSKNTPIPTIMVGKINGQLIVSSTTEVVEEVIEESIAIREEASDALEELQEITRIETDKEKRPLIIIDGKETKLDTFTNLDPDNIESVSVFKNESAIKLYGKKGKNGVVVIKLKK
ncbi:peptidoglycan DD-metalloendopeptidase family protein [Spongiivirga sp. MCCC 1A20706]|uniref:peptidoglycan DD-metalloendopeptidase family protein n=1 Tax=Spongiivirga sp. MCCC 1A20706 TaxID=3160963 RepID=UPI00397796E4